ncbi:unnamed protein product, partial [Amoebophrya sp. A25]|eukprot:GSA25T00026069001.1
MSLSSLSFSSMICTMSLINSMGAAHAIGPLLNNFLPPDLRVEVLAAPHKVQ